MNLPGALRRAREGASFESKSAFARAIGVTPNTVYRIEKGEMEPSIQTLKRWAEECGVSIDWLLRHPTESTNAAHSRAEQNISEEDDDTEERVA